jgi:PAS domain S-box-containing protein
VGIVVLRQVDARLGRLRDMATRAVRGELVASAEAHGTDPIGALGRDLDRLIATIIASRDYQEAVLGSLDVALVTGDGRGRVTLANPRAEELLGRGVAELRGRDVDELWPGEGPLRDLVREVREGAGRAISREVPFRGGLPGGGRVLAVSASRLHGMGEAASHPGGFVLSLLDVTEMREAERRARENERLAALGGMAGGLLHELGNPLAALAMYLDLLRGVVSGDEARDLVTRALQEDTRLREFMEDFRVFAGLAPLRLGDVDLAGLAAESARSLSSPAGPQVEGSGRARGDARLLAHATRNLLRNAVEAGPSEAVKVDIRLHEGTAEIAVVDGGPGLSPAALGEIFEPFRTTKPHGTGLGLMIARRVAELHGGVLHATSAPGEGARFTLRWRRDTWRVS